MEKYGSISPTSNTEVREKQKNTMDDFEKKELYRNISLKREGYKQMRIISFNDKLPSDTVLLQILSEARKYFSDYPNHSWIEFNISESTLRNAEHKNGIPYDFGSLRTIKDSDLDTTTLQERSVQNL